MAEIRFLSLNEVLQIHDIQIKENGGATGILSKEKLKGAINQPKQTFDGQYLYKDLFEMAAVYLTSIVHNHPFMDGNKRTGSHTAILFLYLNGYDISEFHQIELAVVARNYAKRKTDKVKIANFLADRATLVDK